MSSIFFNLNIYGKIIMGILPSISFFASGFLIENVFKKIWNSQTIWMSSETKEKINEDYDAALQAQKSMQSDCIAIENAEREKNGVIIKEAWYGILKAESPDVELPCKMNVTIAVQCLVSDSKLIYDSRQPKSSILGFCDIRPKKRKQLWIHYQFKDSTSHYVLVDDCTPFSLPKASKYFLFYFQTYSNP